MIFCTYIKSYLVQVSYQAVRINGIDRKRAFFELDSFEFVMR